MSIKRWYNNQSYLKKLLYTYLICAALPMLLMISFNYSQTRNLLVEQAYADMQHSVERMESGIDLLLQPYSTIAQTIGNDKTLNILLNRDYSDQPYSDLAYYSRTTLDNLLVLFPSTDWVRFYSSNTTLPENNYYFYRLDGLHDQAIQLADQNVGYMVAVCSALKDGGDEILLLSRINYFSSDVFQNYLAVSLCRETLMSQLRSGNPAQNVYLLDRRGLILASADGEMTGENFLRIQKDWEGLPNGQIQTGSDANGRNMMFLRVDLNMGMALVMTVDQSLLLRDAAKLPLQTLLGFLVLTLLAFVLATMQSRSQTVRLQAILEATGKIGNGQFDCVLNDPGEDEFGQIAGAVNRMNGQINRLIQENYERQLKIKSSEMNLLQEQINPHFLYNALAVISSLALREGGKNTMQSVRYLSDFYRMSLSKGRQTITVGEEVELLRNYMKIQMLRFSDTLEIDYAVDSVVTSWHTLKLILQPLVENAIHHGRLEDRVLHIHVRAGRDGDGLFYEVEDDGAGIEPEKLSALREELSSSQAGFGLKNVDIRIKLNYGETYGVQITSVLGEGTLVRVKLPGIKSLPEK